LTLISRIVGEQGFPLFIDSYGVCDHY